MRRHHSFIFKLLNFCIAAAVLPIGMQAQRTEQPDILFQQERMFEVVAVERSDSATVLDMRIHQRPDLWFTIGHDILLRDTAGRLYPIRRLDSRYGKGLDERIFARHEGEIRVRLVFPPLPAQVDDIDITGEVPTEHGIYGIRLDGRKWQDMPTAEPKGYTMTERTNDTLPLPTVRYGVATIRGHLRHFRKGMLRHVILYQNASRYQYNATALDTLWAPVSDRGDFGFRLPVTHEQPVTLGYEGRRFMMCYAAPDDTTEVGLDMMVMQQPKEQRRSHYSRVERGPLAALANEYNHTQRSDDYSELRREALGRYYGHPDLIGSQPRQLLPEVVRVRTWSRQRFSPALQELMRLNDQLCLIALYQRELTGFPDYISQRGGEARVLYDQRRKRWLKAVQADKTDAYLQMLSSPKQLLCPAFMGVAHLLGRMPTLYPDYVDHEVNALAMKQQLRKDYTQLDSLQLQQNQATLPRAYRLWLENYRRQLAALMADNSQRTDYEVCQLPEVPPYGDHLLFERICKRYRGRLIFLHIWLPTVNADAAIVQNTLLPLQKEFKDYDIAWVHLARFNNENSWRQQLPQLRGYHYALTTDQQPTWIIRSVMGKMQSRYLYVIVDEEGHVVYKHNKPTDLLDLQLQLKKYAKLTLQK